MSIQTDKHKADEFRSFDEIQNLVSRFEDASLPRPQWTHAAHLTVACWYLICHSEPEAATRIREGIKRYNDFQGIVTSKDNGYHETITLFWIRMVHSYLAKTTLECPIVHLVNEMIARYSNKYLPFEYYSRRRLMSWEARTRWLEPDLKSLA